MNLRNLTISGIKWSTLAQIIKQASQLVIIAILARLLSVDDFGLLGMAVVFISFIEIFSEMGVGDALIQKKDIEERHCHSIFWFNFIIGIGLTIILYYSAAPIAYFYNRLELIEIIQVLSINMFLLSLIAVQQAILRRNMEFKKIALIDTTTILISGIIAVMLAFYGFGVWSLVYQLLSLSLLKLVLMFLYSSYHPKFIFSKECLSHLFSFSVNVTGFKILNYFSRNLDYLLIGKFLGGEALGYYTLAYKLMIYPIRNISWMVGKVIFPAFSKIQDDLHKVREGYLKMIKGVSLITFPMLMGLFAVAEEFVLGVFGAKWAPVILLIRILCICGIVQSISSMGGYIILSQGNAKLYFRLEILQTIILTAALTLGLTWGINGVAFMYMLQSVFWCHYCFYIITRQIEMPYKKFYSALWNSYGISLGMLCIILLLRTLIQFQSPVNNLILLSTIGALSYFFLMWFTQEIRFNNKKIQFGFLQ